MKKIIVFMITTFFVFSAFANTTQNSIPNWQKQIENLEKNFNGKIGIYAIDTNSNLIIAYRANENFPIQSTFKLIDVAALLKQSENNKNLLNQTVIITKKDLMFFSPVTKTYLNQNISFNSLAEAAMIYSDNGATNLITKKLGGPAAITAFARTIGNSSFNVEHYEGNLNSNPNSDEDSSTPHDMAISLQKLTLGGILTSTERVELVAWMRNNTTSYQRMRAVTPIGWNVADKTGTGNYGVANDIGILWSPTCKPIVLAIYTAQKNPEAKSRNDIVASTTAIVLNEFQKHDQCFQEMSS